MHITFMHVTGFQANHTFYFTQLHGQNYVLQSSIVLVASSTFIFSYCCRKKNVLVMDIKWKTFSYSFNYS